MIDERRAGPATWSDSEEHDVIEVVLAWQDERSSSVLGVRQAREGQRVTLGEQGDLFVPAERLHAERFDLVHFDRGAATVFVPDGARAWVDGAPCGEAATQVERGTVVEIAIAPLALRVTRVAAATRPAAPLLTLRGSGAGYFAGSAIAHAAVFAAIALFAPSLSAAEEEDYDRDRLLLMQHLLDASAARERETPVAVDPAPESSDVAGGQRATGAEGEAGRPDTDRQAGRWASRGAAKPEDAAMVRERALAESDFWSTLGRIASGDPRGVAAAWQAAEGSGDVDAAGHLFGPTIDDAAGVGGRGIFGRDEGGGGQVAGIGMNGMNAFGHTGSCAPGSDCAGPGIGSGHAPAGRSHVSRFAGPRYAEPVVTSGRLPPEIIQRIVRQNDGRYRFCYESGLRANPNLAGRVTVKFVIDRQGAVAVASDGGSDIPDPEVRRCVIAAFASLSFPAPDSGMLTVSYPIIFSPQ